MEKQQQVEHIQMHFVNSKHPCCFESSLRHAPRGALFWDGLCFFNSCELFTWATEIKVVLNMGEKIPQTDQGMLLVLYANHHKHEINAKETLQECFCWIRKTKRMNKLQDGLMDPTHRSQQRAHRTCRAALVSDGLQDQPCKCVFLTWRGQVQCPGDPYIACAFPRCLFSFKVSSEGEGKKASCVPLGFSVDISLYPFDILDK